MTCPFGTVLAELSPLNKKITTTMIRQLPNTPSNVVAFEAEGEITKPDFTETVMPAVEKAVKQHDELNYLLLLNTELKNFTMQAWMQDALLGLKNITKWRRVAIVT